MDVHRKRAKEYLKSFKTKSSFVSYIDSLMLSQEEEDVAIDVFIKNYSHIQISNKYNISVEKSKKILKKILDKVL